MSNPVLVLPKDLLRTAFGDYFGLADEHADVLIVLYRAGEDWVKVKRLQRMLDSHRPPKRQAVYERIRVLREALETEAIESGGQLDDSGYRLTEVGRAECDQAIVELGKLALRSVGHAEGGIA